MKGAQGHGSGFAGIRLRQCHGASSPVSGMPAACGRVLDSGRYPGMLPAAGFFCVLPGVHRAAVSPLSEIGKTGSGCTADFTSDGQEPLNREHITCSW